MGTVFRKGAGVNRTGQTCTAQIECSLNGCSTIDVEEIDERVPSGAHKKVRCVNGHVTFGIPTAEFRNHLKFYNHRRR